MAAASSPDEAPRTGAASPVSHHQPPSSDNDSRVAGETASSEFSNYVSSRGQPDPYQYAEASVTSGSNSGEEDDRDLGGMAVAAKRLGGHLNGFSSKKRRKQSKPIRLGSGGEADDVPSQSGQDQGRDEDDEGLVNSTTPELEDGERRPQLPFPMTSLPSDLPLNLSAAAAAAHPTLRVLGAELLQNPDRIPTTVASMYQGMLGPFGLPPFPFPFPSSSRAPPTSMSSGTTPPVTAGGRIQIFNPEAYCELCNKEFCNKYFLKTHKANKHGIYSEGVPMSGSPPTSSSPGNPVVVSEAGPSSERPLPPTSQASHGPPTPNSQAGSPFSGAFIAANMGSMRPNFVPLSPGASPSPKDQSNRDLLNRDAPSRESQPGSGGAADSPSGLRSHPPSMMSPRDGSIPDFRQAVEERERLMQREGGPLPLPPTPKENGELRKSLESPQRAPSTGLPGLPQHLNFNPMMFGGLPSLESLRKAEEMDGKRPPIPNIPNVPNVSNSSGGPGSFPKGPFTPEKLRQMGVINADAFCEICCKEFCNKYFLRVHKLKKHGICSPDLPPEKVQKILNQMAKEAGKTGNPPPPIVRPPMTSSSPFNSSGPNSPEKRPAMPMGPGGMPLRPPGLMSLPPLEPLLPHSLKDFKSQMPPPNFDNGPASFRPPPPTSSSQQQTPQKNHHHRDEVIRINEDSEDGRSDLKDRDEDEDNSRGENGAGSDEEGETRRPSEDLQRLQSMIMELNSGKAAAAAAAAAGMLPPPPLSSSNVNKEENTICKVCNKDMENKYFLRAHMMNEHGVLEDPSSAAAGEQGKDNEQRGLPPPPPLLNGLDMANAQDFAAKFLQQMQKGFGVAGLPPLDGDERSFLERVKSELAAVGNGPPPPPGSGGPMGSPSPTGHKKMEKDPNRKPASLSRSYCDICKKELCNKYFMKTHMLKMHGINIEATNSAGVNCHICKKELCSKYFLKVHMQNSHGLMEDGSPIPPHLKENGSGLFPGMFPPLGPPPHELMNAMGNGNGNPPAPATTSSAAMSEKEHYFSRLLGEQSEMSKEKLERQQKMLKEGGASSPPHTCSLCGEGFPEIVALQVHIIKSHGAFPPDSGLFGGLENKMPPLVPAEASAQGSPSEGSNGGSETGGDKSKEDRSEGEVTPNKAPSTPVHHHHHQQPQPPTSCTPTSEALNKQFPHLEMLQRHMLSQQFPGLINPLLSGFPGFPGGPPPLAFANPLQQLLAGGNNGAAAGHSGNSGQLQTSSEANAKKEEDKSSKKRRFKCSKCQSKFRKREDCLRHIHAQHSSSSSSSSSSSRRRLQFSPKILKNRHGVRSHYVKRLMEILRVPTSRGTPSKAGQSGKDNNHQHIMQAFLIKKDNMEEDKEAKSEAEQDFVPSMVYLPVARKINQPMTVAFSLTPA